MTCIMSIMDVYYDVYHVYHGGIKLISKVDSPIMV